MNILTNRIFPPIPNRSNDWCAHVDGAEDGPMGWGSTEAAAIADLKEQLEDEQNV